MSEVEITRFTDTLSSSMNKLFKTGGFALSFGFAGIIMILGAKIFGQENSLLIIIIGATLTFLCLFFFLYTTLNGNAKASKAISSNKDSIDAVQDISIQLTKLVSLAQAYSFKNIDKVNKILQDTIPTLTQIPIVGDKIMSLGLNEVSVVSQSIVDNSEQIENTVKEIQSALIDADHKKLKEYSKNLSDLVIHLRGLLRK